MKLQYRKYTVLLAALTGIAAVLIAVYARYISLRIYDDSSSHLVEVYRQVNYSFRFFLERNWGNLDDWNQYLQVGDEADALTLLKERQDYWDVPQFYFLAEDGSARTLEGEMLWLRLENTHDALFRDGERIISSETTPVGQAVTVFAIPVKRGTFQGFEYSAIAISYANEDIVRSLEVDAFSGESVCFIVDAEGGVFLSTQPGGSIFGNYLSYLKSASDLDDDAVDRLQTAWKNGETGVVSCDIGGMGYYISYQSIGYQNCMLLGIVPEPAADASLLLIQRATIGVLATVFLMIGMAAAGWLVYRNRQSAKKSAIALRYRDMMFDTLSANVDDIFLMLDAETLNVDFLSSNVERLLGIPHDEVMGDIHLLKKSVVGEHDSISREQFLNIPVHGSCQREREYMHQKTGERLWYKETAYHEEIQGIEKYLLILSDRTQEQQMMKSLEEALDTARSANEAKSNFLSNMSHDIRTPMNAIVGLSVLLAKNADEPEKVREYTKKISFSSNHLLSLINDVLDMSKIESGKTSLNMSEFNLPDLLENLYAILRPQTRAKRQELEIHIEGCPAENLTGDSLRLNQILLNLLSNAVKYTREGGRIDFSVQSLPQSSLQYAHLRFTVKDNGIGMSEDFLKTIFEPFSREASSAAAGIQGTGLGMSITKNLVELMGGTIAVESHVGEGSVFTVELSFARSDFEEDADCWNRLGISRVLVADDDETACLEVQAMMEGTGVDVSAVSDGAEAVEAVVNAQDRGEPFHAVLLDWKMPVMDGIEAARQIRAKLRGDIPILVLTSYDWSDIEDEARAAGIDAFLPKPFFVSRFQRTMEELKPDSLRMAETEETSLKGMLFLVAEDNEINAEILSEMLAIEEARCERAENGREALKMFQRSEPGRYDMILMDVQMPVMDGYEATRAIRACGHPMAKTIPIIAMTANAFIEDVHNAIAAGMDAHLAKPVDMGVVKATVERLRKAGETGREVQA